MNKKQTILIIVCSAALASLFGVFPGRYLVAKVSTWPLLNHWKILSPQAPIVITNRETVRVESEADILEAVNLSKSKLSLIVEAVGQEIKILGVATNLTPEGDFVTALGSFKDASERTYSVLLSDGRQAGITKKIADPGTALVFFKANLNKVPVAILGDSKNLKPAQKLVFVKNSLSPRLAEAVTAAVVFSQADVVGKTWQSDYPSRGFGVAAFGSLASGQALINSSGEVVGIWNGQRVISADVLKQAIALYFKNDDKIIRPAFGINYSLSLKQDFLVLEAKSGLQAGDLIVGVNNNEIEGGVLLEEILQDVKPGDTVSFAVLRAGQELALSLTAGELK